MVRKLLIAAAACLAACGQPEPSSPPPSAKPSATADPALASASPRPWFICDAIDQPAIIVAWPADAANTVRIEIHSKTGAPVQALSVILGRTEGAAGSVFQNISRGGVDAGYIRTINTGMLDDETGAYTPPVTSVRIDDQDYSCRWLARTRFAGFTARRSVFITQDADGDLIYQAFDFATPGQPVEFDGGQRSTTFSVEVRDGQETSAAAGDSYAFTNNGYTYEISAPRNGEATLRVLYNGAERLREPFLAFATGPHT